MSMGGAGLALDLTELFILSEDDSLFTGKLRKHFAFKGNPKWAKKDCPHCYTSFSVVKQRKRFRCSACGKMVKAK